MYINECNDCDCMNEIELWLSLNRSKKATINDIYKLSYKLSLSKCNVYYVNPNVLFFCMTPHSFLCCNNVVYMSNTSYCLLQLFH